MPSPDFFLKVGDTASVLADVLKDENGVVVNLTGATVKFSMKPIGGGALKVNAATAVLGTPTAGEVSYTWATGDVDTAGWYLGEWIVTYSNGKIQTFPNGGYVLIAITEDVAATTSRYLTLEELKAARELTGMTFVDLDLALAITSAEKVIEGVCSRRFWADTDALQVRYFAPYTDTIVLIDDLVTLTGLATDPDNDGDFDDTWVAADYKLLPINGPADGRPYEQIVLTSTGSFGSFPSNLGSVRVTGKFGWPSVPAPIREATIIYASRLVKRAREAPFAIVGLGTDNAVRLSRSDPDVMALLDPYVRRVPLMV